MSKKDSPASFPFSSFLTSKEQDMCKLFKLIYTKSMRISPTTAYGASNSVGLCHPCRCFPCSEIVTLCGKAKSRGCYYSNIWGKQQNEQIALNHLFCRMFWNWLLANADWLQLFLSAWFLWPHVWPVSLSTEDSGSIAHYKLPVWYPLFPFFLDESLFISLSHTASLCTRCVPFCTTRPAWTLAICFFLFSVSNISVWIKQTFGLFVEDTSI